MWTPGLSLGADFRRLWLANAVSVAGSGITLAAGPLLIVSITRDPLLVAGAVVAQQLPWLLVALLSGAVVDRLDQRRLVAFVNLVQAAAIGGLAVSVVFDSAHLAAIYVALFVVGLGDTLVRPAMTSLVPAVVAEDGLTRANASLMGVQIVGANLVAPPFGAYLFTLADSLPFAVDAASFVVGAVLVGGIRHRPEPVDRSGSGLAREIAAGVRWLAHHAVLRMLALSLCLMNITLGGSMAILVLYSHQRLGLGSFGYGLLLACEGAGGVVGTLIVNRLTRLAGISVLLRVGLVVEGLTHVSLALARQPWLAMATFVVFGVHASVWGVTTVTLRQRLVPADLRGRVNSVYFTFAVGGMALGSLLGGVFARAFGLTSPFWIAAVVVGMLTVASWKLFTTDRLGTAALAEIGQPTR